MLRIKPKSSGTAAGALNHGAISPGLHGFLFNSQSHHKCSFLKTWPHCVPRSLYIKKESHRFFSLKHLTCRVLIQGHGLCQHNAESDLLQISLGVKKMRRNSADPWLRVQRIQQHLCSALSSSQTHAAERLWKTIPWPAMYFMIPKPTKSLWTFFSRGQLLQSLP